MATPNIYPDTVFEDPPPSDFDDIVDEIIADIKAACKGWGTDEKRLIDVLGALTLEQRYAVNLRYEQMEGEPLKKLMKKECGSGDFGLALQFMTLPPFEAEAKMIRSGTEGFGCRTEIIFPLICGRSNAEIELLKKTYFDCYTADLGVKLNSELGGEFERFIFHCLQASEEEFDEELHTAERAEADADEFYESGQGAWGTDEKALYKLIVASPPTHLRNMNAIYETKYGKSILGALDSELGGKVEEACRFAVRMKMEPARAVAELIKKACRGFGTNELLLTCTLIRYQNLLKAANEEHVAMYEKTIHARVESETSGDYRRLLLKLVDTAMSAEE